MKRPYITLSWAQSLDGRLATKTGDSQWIGGPESLQLAHELRRDNQAILVGIGTVLKDNPRLTCRLPGAKSPVRVVLDSRLQLPAGANLTRELVTAPTWVYCAEGQEKSAKAAALRAQGLTVTQAGTGRPDLEIVLADLAAKGIETLFVEGGAGILTAFLRAGLADRLLVVSAPFLIGQGTEAVGDLGVEKLSEARRPQTSRTWMLGSDCVTELVFHPALASPPAP